MSQEGQPAPPSYGLATIFSEFLVVACALLGILLVFVGQIVLVYATTNEVIHASYVLRYLGGMLSSGALIGGGITNRNLDKFVRLGMLLAAGLIISSMLGLSLR
jgi:hypothetical protein